MREFDRAGTIEEGIAVAHEGGGGGGQPGAHLVLARLGAGVTNGSSGIDGAGGADRTGPRQDRF
jgi:hypothetical protein